MTRVEALGPKAADRVRAGVHHGRVDVVGRELGCDQPRDRRLVVDDQHAACRASPRAGPTGRSTAGSRGSRTVNVVPPPGFESTSIEPPCRSTSDWTIDRPRPEPEPDGPPACRSARKKRSKTRSSCSAGRSRGRCRSRSAPASLVAGGRDPELPAVGRVEVGVGEQVGDDLAHAGGIGVGGGSDRGDVDRRASGRASSIRGRMQRGDLADRLVDRRSAAAGSASRPASTRATSSRSLTRSTRRFVESRMMSTNSRCLGVERRRRREQLDEALDRGQRRAQLVRRGRDELALEPLEPRALGHVADVKTTPSRRRRRPAARR